MLNAQLTSGDATQHANTFDQRLRLLPLQRRTLKKRDSCDGELLSSQS